MDLDEINLLNNQIQELLKQDADYSLIIGFNSLLQSKFHNWITSSFDIVIIDTLWSQFHYPIIKYFQMLHHNHFESLNSQLKHLQSINKSSDFKVKPVEIRKINDNFLKFSKQIYKFYLELLIFLSGFKNDQIPKVFLEYFNVTQKSSKDNMIHLIFKCCLCLGDISRHQSYVETQYVCPSLTNRDFFKFKGMTALEKQSKFKPVFKQSMALYQLCIMLVPSLNEPYNHMGVISNLIDDKFDAIYYFIRSQFTRNGNYKLGLANLNSLIKKHHFTTSLVDLVDSDSDERYKVFLICLIGYFYHPERYKSGPNIVKKISFSKIETELFKGIGSIPDDLLLKFLTILFGFMKLKKDDKLNKFAIRFIEKVDNLKSLRFILHGLDVIPDKLNKKLKKYSNTIKPKRDFYFEEDVMFRDCSLINFRFSDFDDAHLFEDVNLLLGGEKQGNEDELRELAIGYYLHKLNEEKPKPSAKAKTQPKAKTQSVIKPKSQPVPKGKSQPISTVETQPISNVVVPDSLKEIESFISKQANEMKQSIQMDQSNINAMVEDLPPRKNIWQHQPPQNYPLQVPSQNFQFPQYLQYQPNPYQYYP